MKKILLAFALPLLCVLAVQASDYGINVGGVEVSTSNYNNVTGKDINSGASVRYDPSSKTLTVSGLNMERTGGGNYAIHNRSVSGLTIKFTGSNYCSTVGAGLRLMENTDIIVDGTNSYASFTCTGTSDNQNGVNISSGKTVNISGIGTIYFVANGSNCKEGMKGGGSSTKVNLKSSVTVVVQSTSNYAISSMTMCSYDGSKLIVPGNGSYQSLYQCYWSSYNKAAVLAPVGAYYSSGTIYTSSGSPVKSQEIQIHSDYAFIINSSNFPDTRLCDYLLTLYPKGYVTTSEVNSRTSLDISGKSVASLSGLERFTALATLNCSNNSLKSIPDSPPAGLTTLNCSNNQISTMRNLPSNLQYLYCQSNRLTSLPTMPSTIRYINAGYNQLTNVSIRNKSSLATVYMNNNTSLTSLDLTSNAISSIDVSGCSSLKTLAVASNQLTSLSSLPSSLESLQISNNRFTTCSVNGLSKLATLFADNNPYLTTLSCYNNALTFIKLDNNTALKTLDIHGNKFTSMPSIPSSVQSLNASSNSFTSASITGRSSLTSLNISNCASLTSLECYSNALTSLNVNGCTALSTLKCGGNQLTSLGTLPNSVAYIDCSSNPFTSFTLTGRSNLKTLIISNCTSLTSLECYSNALTSLSTAGCSAMTSLICSNNQLTSLPTLPSTIQEINAGSNNFTTLSVTGKTALKTLNVSNNANMTSLYCQSNALTSLNVSDCSALKSLNCSNNQLTSLGTLPTNIEEIFCRNNKFTELTISDLPKLNTLDVSNNTLLYSLIADRNALTSLNYSSCPLTMFSCVRNQLTSLPTMPSSIETIYCGANKFTTLSIAGYSNLSWLEASGNTSLTELDCGENALTYLRVSGCTSLETLCCSENLLASDRFKSYNFSNCPAIKYFDCSNNALETLDVSACSNLQTLDCYFNDLTSLNVEGLAKLIRINCSMNQLSSLSLSGCNALDTLEIVGNKIKAAEMTALVASLRTMPEDDSGTLNVLAQQGEENEFTDDHVAAARAKRWIPYKGENGEWVEMEVSEPTPTYKVGDVNGDGAVNGDDLNTLINILLGKDHDDHGGRDNVDGEGGVDGNDLNMLINILLGKVVIPEPLTEETFTVNGVSFKMMPVEGGTFTMGATDEQGSDAPNNEKPTHTVTLNSFSIGMTEVTQELWEAVMNTNPSYYNQYGNLSVGSNHSENYGTNLQRPVECVSWDQCQQFITILNTLTGQNFRLPTEAEWEYAARGGKKSKGYKYAGGNTLGNVAWYKENSDDVTHSVATKAANELGLYDMSGNVWEWTQDWFGNYSSDAQTNPTGPTSGTNRAYRGGASSDNDRNCRVSRRLGATTSSAFFDLGLRLAM